MKKITIPAEAFVNQPNIKTNFTKIVEVLKDNPSGLTTQEIYNLTKIDGRRVREAIQKLKADGMMKEDKVCRCGITPIYIYK